MNNKIVLLILILITIFSLNFFFNCGLEDDLQYFQEPKNLDIDDNGTGNVLIKFYGYNQEEEQDDEWLFIGYDIYYYFSSASTARRAEVKNPLLSLDHSGEADLIDFSTETVGNPAVSRFPAANYPDMDDFYQKVSIPVTASMIKNVLYEGNNDNVRFYFGNNNVNDNTGDVNPHEASSPAYVMMDYIFPDYDEYKDQDWGSNDSDFAGFYDQDYYDVKGISPVETSGSYKYYTMYLWVVGKGFNSTSERNEYNIQYSIKSSTITLKLEVNVSTDNH